MYRSAPQRLKERPIISKSTPSHSPSDGYGTRLDFRSSQKYDSNTDKVKKSKDHFSPMGDPEKQYVKWGIVWYAPFLIFLYVVAGIGIAIGHHFFYSALHGTQAGSVSRQQWATAIGTAVSFLIVTLLRAASCTAYSQYTWTLVRRKSYKLSTLDKLFALTTEPTGFLGWEMLRKAKIAMLVAFFCWITPLAGIAPPATLSVVPGLILQNQLTSMALIDWNSPSFYDIQQYYSLPSSEVQSIVTQSALGMSVVPLTPPAPNATFNMQFYGPAVQCSQPNGTQQSVLDYYNAATLKSRSFMTNNTLATALQEGVPNGNTPATIQSFRTLVFSAFAPFAGVQGWLYGMGDQDSIDPFNNWNVDLPWDLEELGYTVDSYRYDDIVQKMFIQTSDKGIFCMLGNASYHVTFEFVNGVQMAVNYTTSGFAPTYVMRSGGGGTGSAISAEILPGPYNGSYHTGFELSYMAFWSSFTSLLSGNISMGYVDLERPVDNRDDTNLTLIETSSRILLNGLSACDEITGNVWNNLPMKVDDPNIPPLKVFEGLNLSKTNPSNNFFKKPQWMCRNRTLSRAIEDLASNITIGMLSSARLTAPNTTTVQVTYAQTHNIYEYSPLPLVISYAIAIGISLACTAIGVYSFLVNGVAHSNSFSSFIATTRNEGLEALMSGSSIGAVPLNERVAAVKLKFGEIQCKGREQSNEARIGFGFEDEMGMIEKFGKYV